MRIVRKCPGCGSPNIRGSLMLEDSQWIQVIVCKDCPYENHREIGSAEEQKLPEEDEEDEA